MPMTISPNASLKGLPKKLTLFAYCYRKKDPTITVHPSTIYDKLHGYSEIRVVKTETGGTKHKIYSYPGIFSGIWHRDLIRGVLIIESKHAGAVADFFKRYRVPFARAAVKEIFNIEKMGRSNGSK